MKIFSKLFTKSKRVGALGRRLVTVDWQEDHFKYIVPIGGTQLNSTPQLEEDMRMLNELATQSKLFGLGCNDTVHEP
jgi:hypothetical protein